MYELQSMLMARGGLAAVVLHQMFYIMEDRMARELGTVEDVDLEVAMEASCGGEIVVNVWQTRPCLLTPRRGLAVAVMELLHASEARGAR